MNADVAARLRRVWRERAGEPFLIDAIEERAWTYGAFVGQALALAERLRGQGLGRGDRLAILLESSAELAALYFACLHLGAVAMPVTPGLSARDLEVTLGRSGAKALACSPATAPLVPAALRAALPAITFGDPTGPGWRLTEGGPTPADAFERLDLDALFTVHFTSGTTSLPKGVAHRAGSLLSAAAAFADALGIDASSRFLHILPMTYMAGCLNLLLCPFLAGGSVVVDRAWSPRTLLGFWRTVRERGVTALWLVPAMMASLLRVDRSGGAPSHGVRLVCAGTAPLPEATRAAFAERYRVDPLESYGLSETLFLTSQRPAPGPRTGSVGQPLPGVELSVRDDAGGPLGVGQDGEVWARTPWNLVGYLDYEAGGAVAPATEAWFPTGDLGHQDAQGRLLITGRKKDLIIRGGLNVSPRALEEALLRHGAVAEAAVVGVPHPLLGEDVVAVVALGAGHGLVEPEKELRRWCQGEVAAAAVPARILVTEALPRTTTGKVIKAEVRAWAAGRL